MTEGAEKENERKIVLSRNLKAICGQESKRVIECFQDQRNGVNPSLSLSLSCQRDIN